MLGFVRLLNIFYRFKVYSGLTGSCFVFQHISYCQPFALLGEFKRFEDEIKELIELAQYLRKENEDLQAKMIMMNAKLQNEEAKVKRLTLLLYAKTN